MSLARPTSRCTLFDGENISFDASLVIYINSTNIPPIMIINRIYENQNLLSLQLVSFLFGLRTYRHPGIGCYLIQNLLAILRYLVEFASPSPGVALPKIFVFYFIYLFINNIPKSIRRSSFNGHRNSQRISKLVMTPYSCTTN